MSGDVEARLARRGTVRRALGLAAISAVIVLSVLGRSLTAAAPRSALSAAALAQPVGPAGAAAGSPVPSATGKLLSSKASRHTTAPRVPSARTTAATSPTPHRPTNRTTAPRATTPPPSATRTVTGAAYDVSYGLVQLRVTFSGNRIADVTAVSLPQGGRSSDISAMAAPQLRREALAAQSANINAVSGASYTSAGYARSLQSAIDRNHQ